MSPLARISRKLCREVQQLSFEPPVSVVYNPLDYARPVHEAYLDAYGDRCGGALMLGMNPGPFGMAQTGVPFGDVTCVRNFLRLDGPIAAPARQHAKRPVQGFDCPRREVSGSRLWGWAQARFGSRERFFDRFFVVNYCPLSFMADSGRNIIPEKLPPQERQALFAICDRALARIVEVVRPARVIGVGGFAQKRAKAALPGFAGPVGSILHPSPASPLANRGWAERAHQQLVEMGVLD